MADHNLDETNALRRCEWPLAGLARSVRRLFLGTFGCLAAFFVPFYLAGSGLWIWGSMAAVAVAVWFSSTAWMLFDADRRRAFRYRLEEDAVALGASPTFRSRVRLEDSWFEMVRLRDQRVLSLTVEVSTNSIPAGGRVEVRSRFRRGGHDRFVGVRSPEYGDTSGVLAYRRRSGPVEPGAKLKLVMAAPVRAWELPAKAMLIEGRIEIELTVDGQIHEMSSRGFKVRTLDLDAQPLVGEAPRCFVCGTTAEEAPACRRCQRPHHVECWRMIQRCSAAGCAGTAVSPQG